LFVLPLSLSGAILRTRTATRQVLTMAVAVIENAKAAALASRSLNPRPEAVTDPVFCSNGFCDPRDAVQVKYEMVRRIRVDKGRHLLAIPTTPALTAILPLRGR